MRGWIKSTIACLAIGITIGIILIVVANRRIDNHREEAFFWDADAQSLEGQLSYADFVGEVRILGINRRYMSLGFDDKTGQMIVLPDSSEYFDVSKPDDSRNAGSEPITEYDAEVVSTIGGNLHIGDRIVIRRYGHGPISPEEVAVDLSSGMKMERAGETFVYLLSRVADGRYVAVGAAGRMLWKSDQLQNVTTGEIVQSRTKFAVTKDMLPLLVTLNLGTRRTPDGHHDTQGERPVFSTRPEDQPAATVFPSKP